MYFHVKSIGNILAFLTKSTSLITKQAAIVECYPLFPVTSILLASTAKDLHVWQGVYTLQHAPGTLKIKPFAVLLS